MGVSGGNNHDELTECALAAGSGDRRALERFVRATQRDVWRFLAHLTSVDLADDLTQETYLRALPSLSRFAARSSARTWLFSIARRVAVDNIRAAVSRPRTVGTDDWATSAENRHAELHDGAAGFEDLVEMNLLLDDLPADRREALVLTQVLGLSYTEVAEICGCPIGTVRSRIARAREDLLRAGGARRTSSG
ncbi:RNA polymerase sigma-54 factor RpoN [Alloactinosynnema sp. L-07]|uniref:sigma-70 family RNA polymerase sigma factor n=1 Tax=Alloactinosynnema sp. L-07 TaxID=1653480 RepID=UPI00065F0816|nr:sigma-70 family RNA polymerase sigma factor [Alloactinosynnema sp. L-07]CRK57534.1 RNA polymerase sigma-54 factor RpoN [Alloactinosynnema sp. L-07]